MGIFELDGDDMGDFSRIELQIRSDSTTLKAHCRRVIGEVPEDNLAHGVAKMPHNAIWARRLF